jgi:DNA-binding NarL/FixJ family response regulator
MKTARILLVDDHEVVRRGLRAVLDAQPRWKVIGEAATGREAVQLTKELQPTVVVMGISMPELNGFEATRQILKAAPKTEVLILTMHGSERLMRDVLQAGARGYLLKSDPASDVVAAVQALSQHKPFFTPMVSEVLLQAYRKVPGRAGKRASAGLTPREREVVQLLAEGKTTKEVANSLGISAKTAETHRSNIQRKLDFHSLSDLVRYAIRNKIVEA